MPSVGNAESNEPRIGRYNQPDFLPVAARFHRRALEPLGERQIRLVSDEHGLRAIVETPLAQFTHRYIRDIKLLGRLDQLGLLDTGKTQNLPHPGQTVRLVDGDVLLHELGFIMRSCGCYIRPDRHIVHALIHENLRRGHQLAAGTTRAVRVLHIKQAVRGNSALDDRERTRFEFVSSQAQPRRLTGLDMLAQARIQRLRLIALLIGKQ